MALSSCATHSIVDPRACPPIVKYTKAEQQKFLDELDTAGPMTKRFTRDYGKLRDSVRACKGS